MIDDRHSKAVCYHLVSLAIAYASCIVIRQALQTQAVCRRLKKPKTAKAFLMPLPLYFLTQNTPKTAKNTEAEVFYHAPNATRKY